jgi:hypothetical protein
MCTSRPSAPPPPDPKIAEQQEEQKAQTTEKKKDAKEETLQRTVTRLRGGTGRRSLIKGSGGGMGFYNEYLS